MPTKAKPKKASQPYEPNAITLVEYGSLQRAFDFLNVELFDGVLPDPLITLHRRAHSKGYFSPDRFSGRVDKTGRSELALNPDTFGERTDRQIVSTLCHEQCHFWQHVHGKAPSRGYHNRQWADRMIAIGLQPSSSGDVGGKETGARISHYIVEGGPFDQAFDRLEATGWRLNLQSPPTREPDRKQPDSKTKFSCSECRANAWGRPDLAIICEPCGRRMLTKEQLAPQPIVDLDTGDLAQRVH